MRKKFKHSKMKENQRESGSHLLKSFPWDEVTFRADENGNFTVGKDARDAWNKFGFFVVKNLFSQDTMTALEKCSKDTIIQVKQELV